MGQCEHLWPMEVRCSACEEERTRARCHFEDELRQKFVKHASYQFGSIIVYKLEVAEPAGPKTQLRHLLVSQFCIF